MANIVSLVFLEELSLVSVIVLFLFYQKPLKIHFGKKQRINSIINTSFPDSLNFVSPGFFFFFNVPSSVFNLMDISTYLYGNIILKASM